MNVTQELVTLPHLACVLGCRVAGLREAMGGWVAPALVLNETEYYLASAVRQALQSRRPNHCCSIRSNHAHRDEVH